MTFSVGQDVTSTCCNCGLVSALNLPDPSKCHVTGKGLEAANVGERSAVLLQTVNFPLTPTVARKPAQRRLAGDISRYGSKYGSLTVDMTEVAQMKRNP